MSRAKSKIIPTNYFGLIAPILSITILVLGMGALTTFTTLRLHEFKTNDLLIGLISASYFIGLTLGGYKSQHLVLRVGHIRSYAAFSAVFASAVLLQGLFEHPWFWIALRFLSGFCLAGCFLVIESWLLGASTRKNRGTILAVYMISYYGGQAIGQFFLKIPNLMPLEVYIIGSLFLSLSILPVSVTRFHAPYAEEPNILSFSALNKKAPVAIWGALSAGFILSVIYSLYPLYLSHLDWQQGDVALFMSSLLLGAALFQYPIGWLSDRYDRRIVLAGMVVLCSIIFILIAFETDNFYRILIYSMLLGGATFTIYPISINHGVDHFTSKDLISATAAIMLAYGVGSSIGPGLTSILMHDRLFHTLGFIYALVFVSIILLVYLAYMVYCFRDLEQDHKSHYVPLPDTTVEIIHMDPEIREKDIKSSHVESIE